MCGCWRFLVVRLCCKPGFRGGPGGNRRVGGGGPPPPLKGGPRHNRPKLLHLHRSPPNTCYARGNSGSSPLPFERKIQKESRLRNNDQFSKLSNSWSEKGSGYVLPSSPRPSPVASPLHSSPCATHCCPRIGVPFKLARQCCRQQSVAVLCEPA